MLTRTILRSSIVTGVMLLATATAVAARAEGGIGSVDCHQDPSNPTCTVHVGESTDPDRSRSNDTSACHTPSGTTVPCYKPGEGSLADDGCYYLPAVGTSLQAADLTDGPAPASEKWYIGYCDYPPYSGQTRFRLFDAAAAPDLEVLTAQAVAELNLPTPVVRLNPASRVRQLVHVPTWIWLDASSWWPRSATAAIPGLSVTATAAATQLTLSTGDGATVACRGRGTAWTPGTDPNVASPTCGHTYVAPGSLQLTATVTWKVAWAGGGTTGAVPALTTTTSIAIRVLESQALNSSGG